MNTFLTKISINNSIKLKFQNLYFIKKFYVKKDLKIVQ